MDQTSRDPTGNLSVEPHRQFKDAVCYDVLTAVPIAAYIARKFIFRPCNFSKGEEE